MSSVVISSDDKETAAAFHPLIKKCIADDAFSLPMLPQVASQVMSMVNDINADMQDLSDLIHKDQALAGHVLRISNSAAYGSSEKIVSLSQAVARLGMSLLGDVALAASLQNGVFSAPGFGAEIKELWSMSLASGAWGKDVARAKRHNVEGQFLCSLLHAIGKPIVLQIVADINKIKKVELTPGAVNIMMRDFHRELGGKIAKKWELPQQVQIGIEYYLSYSDAPKFEKEAMMTYLSHRLGYWITHEDEVSREEIQKDPVFAELNFYPDDVEQLLDKKDDVLEVVKSMAL